MAQDWNAKIIEEFRTNGGQVGGPFAGAPLILIHHTGARTGTVRVSPVMSFPQPDGGWLIVASKGGAPDNPDWYYNLKAYPEITAEFGEETFAATAAELSPAEREQVWPQIVAERPGFGEYQEKTSRVIPVFRVTRTG
ncbi:nitroreductase family deazaflavin-dependent oxidoreductase [Hamadaea tsunoensis]|uniref:nitroreductase family deazaflavin-dependent oxidoreductase n=1 Tax=Hamadaea tsunoensis TaxID=53368 RepID=UPI0004035181|nr:nitroreductase family deazaflavin-dependent oxidoreductase [Hamadaea tsunoensis]